MTILKILTRIYFVEKCLEVIFSQIRDNFSSMDDVNNKYVNECYELWVQYNDKRKVVTPGSFSDFVKAFKMYYSLFGERVKRSGGMTYMFNKDLLLKYIRDLQDISITTK